MISANAATARPRSRPAARAITVLGRSGRGMVFMRATVRAGGRVGKVRSDDRRIDQDDRLSQSDWRSYLSNGIVQSPRPFQIGSSRGVFLTSTMSPTRKLL